MNLLEKSQFVRLIDIFIYGPFSIWYILRYNYSKKRNEKAHPLSQALMLFIAITTIIYNGYNFIGHLIPLYPLI
jgi:hypothetical protein